MLIVIAAPSERAVTPRKDTDRFKPSLVARMTSKYSSEGSQKCHVIVLSLHAVSHSRSAGDRIIVMQEITLIVSD